MSAVFPMRFNLFPVRRRPELSIRQKLEVLEAALRAGPTIDLATRHYFSQGVYAREIFIPRGSCLVGKIHKHIHLNIISAGDISVLTENGVQRVRAPFTIVSPPGTKRAGYAHADTVWTTIHGTDETDLEVIEARYIAKDHAEFLAFQSALQIGKG